MNGSCDQCFHFNPKIENNKKGSFLTFNCMAGYRIIDYTTIMQKEGRCDKFESCCISPNPTESTNKTE